MSESSVSILCGVVSVLLCAQGAQAAGPAPIPISECRGDFGSQFAKTGSAAATSFITVDGERVVKVEEEAKLYPGMGITLNGFDGMQSVYVSFEMKTVNISRNAAMDHYWTSAAGKRLTAAQTSVRVGGTTEWTKYERILSSPIALKTGGIRIVFLVWSAAGDGYALLRNPTIRIATPGSGERIRSAVAKQPVVRPTIAPTVASFLHRFTNKMHGVSYDVERGGYGWFLLWGKQRMKGIEQLRVTAPAAVDFELYLFRGGKAEFVPGTARAQDALRTWTFTGLERFRWNCWGNALLFKVGPDAPEAFEISLTFVDPEGAPIFTEPIPIKILEPLDLALAQAAFENRVYYAHPFRWIAFDDARAVLANGLLRYLKDCGFTSAGYLTEAKTQPFPVEKGEVITQFSRMPDRLNRSPVMAELLEKHGIPMAMAASGVRSTTELETQAVADQGLRFYGEMLRRTGNEVYRARELVWVHDYEPYAHEGPATQYSFAPESIAAFRAFLGVPAATELTPRIILSEYVEQWVRFRCQQHALVIKAQAEALKAFSPQAIYALSTESLPGSDEHAAEFFRRSAVDLRMMDPYVDLHLPMIYNRNATYYRRVEATVKGLKKPVLPTITCGYGNAVRDPGRLRRLMVAAAFLGAGGVYHWPGFWAMDANELQSSQRAMALIAKLEPFLQASELVVRNGQVSCPEAKSEHLYHAVRGAGLERLVFLAHDGTSETCYPLVRLPEAKRPMVVSLFPTGEILSPGDGQVSSSREQLRQGFRLRLPPSSMALVRYTPAPSSPTAVVVDTRVWEREYRAQLAAAAAKSRGAKKHGMSYRLDGATLRIDTPAQSLRLAMDDCAVGEWSRNEGGKQQPLLHILGRESFDFPGVFLPKNTPVELEKVEFGKDAVTVVVYYKVTSVPYEGLAFRKTFTISRDTPKVAVGLAIIPADGFRQFALRIAHGVRDPGTRFLLDGKPVLPSEKLLGGEVYTRAATEFTPFILSKLVTAQGTFTHDRLGLLLPGRGLAVECGFGAEVKGVMNWHDDTVATMELMYDKAYDHNDPHRARVWTCAYTLEARPQSAR